MNILEQMVQEKRDTVLVGIGRWHIRAIGQEDYSRAHEGTLVVLSPYVTKDNAELGSLDDDDPKKVAETVKLLAKMTEEERTRLASLQRSTASAGIEGVSRSDEKCLVAEAIRAEEDNTPNVAAMVSAESDFDGATTRAEQDDARERYRKATKADREYVGARHRCSCTCFSTYRLIKFVPREQDEDAGANLIHINTIPATTITRLFSEIMALSDEGGRARRRIAAFQSGPKEDAGRARPPVRPAAKRAAQRHKPRGPQP